MAKQKVLFVCTGNSARSQMAEVLLRHKAGDQFSVFSAGTQPEPVDARAVSALEKFGISLGALNSTPLSKYSHQQFDYVITLCDKAAVECRAYPGAARQMAWDFPDPKTRAGSNPFTTTLNELNSRLSMFVLLESKVQQPTPSQINQVSSIEPVAFYKCLTDEIRIKTLMLTNYFGELCVCELMEALQQDSQPKVSRNLAVLKKAKIIVDRKHGQWVFYRINPDLPQWAKSVIAQTTESNIQSVRPHIEQLAKMSNRPDKVSFCR